MRRIQDVLEGAGAVAAELAGARDRLWQAGEGDLDAAARVLGEVARAAEALLVGVVAEAQERGTIAGSRCASAAAWVRERAGEREHGTAGAVAMLAAATQGPGGESLRQALWEDGIGVRLAAKAVREADRTLPLLPGADRSEVVGHYLDRAAATDGSRRALDQLTREILARYGDDVLDELDERARAVNSLTVARRVGGRVRYTLELCVPDAARLDAAVNGLAAPRPAATAVCDGDGPPALVADTRSAAQRRADALLELVARPGRRRRPERRWVRAVGVHDPRGDGRRGGGAGDAGGAARTPRVGAGPGAGHGPGACGVRHDLRWRGALRRRGAPDGLRRGRAAPDARWPLDSPGHRTGRPGRDQRHAQRPAHPGRRVHGPGL